MTAVPPVVDLLSSKTIFESRTTTFNFKFKFTLQKPKTRGHRFRSQSIFTQYIHKYNDINLNIHDTQRRKTKETKPNQTWIEETILFSNNARSMV